MYFGFNNKLNKNFITNITEPDVSDTTKVSLKMFDEFLKT